MKTLRGYLSQGGAGQRYILAGIGGGDPSIIEQNVIGEEHQYSLFVCSLTSSL